MVYVTFYSGFKAKTVTDKIEAIEDIFGNYEKVAKYDETKVQKIIDSNKVIGHRQKINGIIHNANQIKAIKKQFGSFDKYFCRFAVVKPLNNMVADSFGIKPSVSYNPSVIYSKGTQVLHCWGFRCDFGVKKVYR